MSSFPVIFCLIGTFSPFRQDLEDYWRMIRSNMNICNPVTASTYLKWFFNTFFNSILILKTKAYFIPQPGLVEVSRLFKIF